MHVITLLLALIAVVLFAVEASNRVTSRWSLIPLGLMFFALAFIGAWTLRGEDLIYFIE